MSGLRHDPLHDRWVVVAGDRHKRPKEFRRTQQPAAPAFSAECPFCPGNEDLTPPETSRMPDGAGEWQLRAVPNRFPIFSRSEVVIETPRHNAELHDADVDLAAVLHVLQARYRVLRQEHPYVAVFRNRGPEAGASLRHPHSQLIATPVVPPRVAHEARAQREATQLDGECPWCRMVATREPLWQVPGFRVFLPDAPPVAFTLWLVPEQHGDFADAEGLEQLAVLLRDALRRLDQSLQAPPYNLIVHTAPREADWHWHVEIFPRLGTFAGFEWVTGFTAVSLSPHEIEGRLKEVP